MRSRTALLSIIVSLLFSVGCRLGEMGPMPMRLDVETQHEINQMWQNALTPANRLDRDLLMDVLLKYAMYWHGVDRVRATAEKDFVGGRVVMDLNYDRNLSPENDTFSVTVVNDLNQVLRIERYNRSEIDARIGETGIGPLIQIGDPENLTDEERAAMQEDELRRKLRRRQIRAATQPADWIDDESDE